ncbi:fatty acid desaturase family protein [Lysobacter niastensis]|uniref:Fatty acid desaturase n=1 Tax=Lysobacter niastensis TaxID=380629 RepID=A0ABS0B7L1_9GAMM|nr:fatty acid desaturase [Lysobacter niastensis]MBF6023100.1 fatty acid desaturase [Lysobacter niastensis]
MQWSILLLAHAGLLFLSIGLAGLFENAVWWLTAAAVYAFASVQIGFLGHDFEHGQVPLPRHWRGTVGSLCWNLLLGVSLRWWRQKHHRHHRHTHIAGSDPDLYSLFAYDRDTARALVGPQRWFVACQAWLFWPVTAFARIYFQWLGMLAAVRLPWRQRVPEVLTLCLHHVLTWAAAWEVLGAQAVWFIAAGQALSGLYMGLAFSTNHLGMPLASESRAGRAWQIAHTRNIRTNRVGAYLLGGLNLQIEHHLYPALDRSAVRAMQPAIERECRAAGIPYRSTGLINALIEVQASLHRVAREAARR